MRILITRPAEDGAEIAQLLTAMGHEAVLAPLLAPRWFDGPPLELDGVAAILATSANGIRALIRRTTRRDLPVFAVGPQTTSEAKAAGFACVKNADGDAVALAQAVPRWIAPDAGALLHVCGEDTVGNLATVLGAQGYAVRRAVLYAVDPQPLPPSALQALRDGAVDAALFFSPRSARIFRDAVAGIPLEGVTAFCISPATATALAGLDFVEIRAAARPNQAALLALVPDQMEKRH